jgi:hypothetical protein
LIGLGVAGGTIPTGLAGIAHAGAVVGGTAAALTVLVGLCVAAPALTRRWRRRDAVPVSARSRPDTSVIRTPARGI